MPDSGHQARNLVLVVLAVVATVALAIGVFSRWGAPPERPESERRTPSVAPSTQPRGTVIRIAAVGDMNPDENVDPTSDAGLNAADISAFDPDIFFALGDFQYPTGGCADLVAYWDELWGPLVAKMYHVAGPVHDWESVTRQMGYQQHTNGACPGQTTGPSRLVTELGHPVGPDDFWSSDLGSWHLVGLPSGLWRYDPEAARAMTARLDADLAAASKRGQFSLVAYHDPYFTGTTAGHERALDLEPWIAVMDKYDVRLTLSGSQHNYERSCPVLSNDSCTSTTGSGTTAFQVSTGGTGEREFIGERPPFTVQRFTGTYGWLELQLRPNGAFSWQFHAVSGPPNTDAGFRPAP